jgi:hypothetical protein
MRVTGRLIKVELWSSLTCTRLVGQLQNSRGSEYSERIKGLLRSGTLRCVVVIIRNYIHYLRVDMPPGNSQQGKWVSSVAQSELVMYANETFRYFIYTHVQLPQSQNARPLF